MRLREPIRGAPIAVALAVAVALLCAACGSSAGASRTATATMTTSMTRTADGNRGGGPLGRLRLWVNPSTPASAQVAIWRHRGDHADARLIAQIARRPTAKWLTGAGQSGRQVAAAMVDGAARAHAVAQLVLYNIPDRDCHGLSGGGAPSAPAYLAWVRNVARGIGSHPVIVILEPDAIDQAASGCIGTDGAHERYGMLADASKILHRDPHAHIYLDAGTAGWLAPAQIVQPLYLSGITHDAGFAVNVANFYSTAQSVAYGRRLSRRLKGAHFVIDTSRNGNGPPPGSTGTSEWCNPPGRALGHPPTTHTSIARVDALLWVKYPGASDGVCRPGQPSAGTWWPSYALSLVRNRHR